VRTIRRSYFGAFTLLTAMALLCVLAGSSTAAVGDTTRVSVASDGTEANSFSLGARISDDGRYVAFTSVASNLVPGDTNNRVDAFVRDLQTGTNERVSVDSSGNQANDHTNDVRISADGRYIVFLSSASNLVAGDTNGQPDVFVRDRQTQTTERVSVDSSGNQRDDESSIDVGGISADGRFVVFPSSASNLVENDTNGVQDTFIRDRQTQSTERVSVASDGTEANGASYFSPSISSNGRFVTFASEASNLVSGDTNGVQDTFVRDRDADEDEVFDEVNEPGAVSTERVSVASDGTEANGWNSFSDISADGRFVVFSSSASNLVPGDFGADDVFVHDRQTGANHRVSLAGCATQADSFSFESSISPDGRYVAFTSFASNLVSGDTNNTNDVFVRDLHTGTTERVSVDSSGNQANDASWTSRNARSVSTDGRVAFYSYANNLVTDDTNNQPDIFLHELQTGTTQPNDDIAPTTDACAITNGGATYEPDTWTNQDVQLSFSAQDNEDGSGVKDIRFSATGAQSIPGTVYNTYNSPVIKAEGTTTISYFATDNEGNQESPAKTFTVKLDKTPPAVSSTSPPNNATGVAATANISATFTESGSGIDLGTFSSSTFQVVQLKPKGNVPVSSGTFSLNEGTQGSQTVTFDPESSLAKGAYRVTITGVADNAGNALANDYTWQFATAGPPKR
jgi:Bacterial Ig-like domain/WD40-like Beta Propeller Repeat